MSFVDAFRTLKTLYSMEGEAVPIAFGKTWAKSFARHMDGKGEESEFTLAQCEEIEKMRSTLLVHIREFKDDTGFEKQEGFEALTCCMALDMNNALYVMKIERDDQACPRGIVWGKDPINEKIEWNGKKARCAITIHFNRFAEALGVSDEQKAVVEQLQETKYPEWMVEKFGL